VDDQRRTIRSALVQGQEAGRNPRNTALDIVGRINRDTGRRQGGLLGLTSQQAQWVQSARSELASGDPAQMRNYLGRKQRDKRFDSLVRRAIADERPVSSADINRLVGRYSDSLLRLRGETIARTETLTSAHAGQMEGMQQLIESGKVQASNVRRIWKATGDGRTRDSHLALHGESVGWNEAFTSPMTGASMMHPGDATMGAPGEDTIQCRCYMEVRVDYLANVR